MKTPYKRKLFTIFTLITISVYLMGCASAQTRRLEYVNNHFGLDPEIRYAILNGRICTGMTYNDVIASWGKPEAIREYYDITGARVTAFVYLFTTDNAYGWHTLYFINGKLVAWDL